MKEDKMSFIFFWGMVCVFLLYLFFCLYYNLQFYTEDERYVQRDMTDLTCYYQWKLIAYRVSSSLGSFLYYPLKSFLEVFNSFLKWATEDRVALQIVPMTLSKLVHSIMAMAAWIWLIFEFVRLFSRRFDLPRWSLLLSFVWIAMLPINIFLVKTNNYDSLYCVLCLFGGLYYLEFYWNREKRYLWWSFFLLALALQEKFAAFPVLWAILLLTAFSVGKRKKPSNRIHAKDVIKENMIVIGAMLAGSFFPIVMRAIAELLWQDNNGAIVPGLLEPLPFSAFYKPINTAAYFLGTNLKLDHFLRNGFFWILSAGFIFFSTIIWRIKFHISKKKAKKEKLKNKRWLLVVSALFQIFIVVVMTASKWYEFPEAGVYPFDTPVEGTYVPKTLTDSHTATATFYYGVGHVEYLFIGLIKKMGVFARNLYTPVLALLFFIPIFNLISAFSKEKKDLTLLHIASGIFIGTMAMAMIVIATGVGFGARYASIYLCLAATASFLALLHMGFQMGKGGLIREKYLKLAMLCLASVCIMELLPYGPSYQAFGNIFHPVKSVGGWGEATGALVQDGKKNEQIRDYIDGTFANYTGLGIETPFFSPLINLRLISSQKHPGMLRKIKYFLVEKAALKQSTYLQDLLGKAQKTPNAIVWEWIYPKEASAWLIDLSKIGIEDFEKSLDPSVVERHYGGEWMF